MNIFKKNKESSSTLYNWNQNDDKNKNDQGPPNLDEVFKKFQKQLSSIFGNKKSGGSGGNFNWGNGVNNTGIGFILGLIAVVLVLMIGIMGFYKVNPSEEAAVFRFGKYTNTEGPGPHWVFPFIYRTEIVNTSAVNQKSFEDELITKNVNIVKLSLVVQYKIGNLHDYLFNVKDPVESLTEATRSSIRQVIADSSLDEVLTTVSKGGQLGDKIYDSLAPILKSYKSGLDIKGVEILSVQPPNAVKEAFNDAIQAQEDEVKYQNQAEAYRLKQLPYAEGEAIAYIQEAEAYSKKVVFEAQGEVSKFDSLLPEYKKAPIVTRSRMYLSAMQNILEKTPKVFIDSKASNNMLYIPWDKLSNQLVKNNQELLKDFASTSNREMDILDKIIDKKSPSIKSVTRSENLERNKNRDTNNRWGSDSSSSNGSSTNSRWNNAG